MNRFFEIAGGFLGIALILGVTGWVCFRLLKRVKRGDGPPETVFKLLFSVALAAGEYFVVRSTVKHLGAGLMADFGMLLLVAGVIVAGAVALSVVWAPQISALLISPLTNVFDGGNEPPEPKPLYSIAQTKRKRGKYLEAVVEIRRQLDRFPNDFEGVMLLAGIQAEDLQDLPGAEVTLNHFCSRPVAPPQQVAAAMNQLADWHLKLAQDADSARAALENITTRFPDTGLALLAAQRIAHLGGAEELLLAAHDRQPVAMPEGVKNVGLLESAAHLVPAETGPAKLAAAYVKHLELHPRDTEIREKLAVIYADHYQRLDLAAGELEQLIEEPNQPAKRVARWLNLLADLQIRCGADYDTVRRTLEKIGERFPNGSVAELARMRLNSLKLELKGKTPSQAVKLGVYEQNLGLKRGSPRQL
jgi:tetratricopeptide (TPR) repeat protein